MKDEQNSELILNQIADEFPIVLIIGGNSTATVLT
jgi:hypothetical protein